MKLSFVSLLEFSGMVGRARKHCNINKNNKWKCTRILESNESLHVVMMMPCIINRDKTDV